MSVVSGGAVGTVHGEGCSEIRSVRAFFQLAAKGIETLTAELGSDGPGVSFGRLAGSSDLFDLVQQRYGVTLASGFEDNAHVSGGVLRGTEVFGNERDDAMLLLEFHSGAVDLPLHVHEQSERFIVVERGRGFFHYVDPEGERNTVRARTVREGETIVFSRGLIHTFCAPTEPLRLLSYHAPFFEVQDPRQWMVPETAERLQPTLDAFHRLGDVRMS